MVWDKRTKKWAWGVLVLFFSMAPLVYSWVMKEPIPSLSENLQSALSHYIASEGESPEDYLLEKFEDHNIVILGEYHRVKHDVIFVQGLIPRLYKAGIHNLGIEFGSYELQSEADSIVTAQEYDEEAVRSLVFRYKMYWCYVEYMDLYRAAWELNSSLDPDDPKFRIVGLGYRPNLTVLQDNMSPELWQSVWYRGEPDPFMAAVAIKEFVTPNEKALIYCGRNHSFTKFHQPVYDSKNKKLLGKNPQRLGNLLHDKVGEQSFTLLLHSPWESLASTKFTYPVGGAIDRVMESLGNTPVGFDTHETPFGDLPGGESGYCLGYPDFTLATICDGYIFLKPIREFEGCTLYADIFNGENFEEAMTNHPSLLGRRLMRWQWMYKFAMKYDANMKHYFRHLM